MRRVVITGAGTINPLGQDVAETFKSMQNGHCAIAQLDIPDVDRLNINIGAAVPDFDPFQHIAPTSISMLDRATQFAIAAAEQAVAQSGLAQEDFGPRTGVVMGTAGGGLTTSDDAFRAVYQDGKSRVHPFTVPRLMHNAAASQLSIRYGAMGPAYTVSTACAASNHAMGQAFQLIRSGACDLMITGGAEAMLSFGGIKAWEGLRVLSPDGCRPFSQNRNGMVMGEGAAVFVFEERANAIARGANILAEIRGFAMNADAGDIVAPSTDGAIRVMQGAVDDANITAGDIDYINAHGTGTQLNDASESTGINALFGSHRPYVSSTKSMHGHLIGATGAVELLSCIMALTDGIIGPTVNVDHQAQDCPINLVKGEAAQASVEFALSNAFAFGGLNAALVLSR